MPSSKYRSHVGQGLLGFLATGAAELLAARWRGEAQMFPRGCLSTRGAPQRPLLPCNADHPFTLQSMEQINLSNLRDNPGARKKRRRVGRSAAPSTRPSTPSCWSNTGMAGADASLLSLCAGVSAVGKGRLRGAGTRASTRALGRPDCWASRAGKRR